MAAIIHESMSRGEDRLSVPLSWSENVELLYFKEGHFHLMVETTDYDIQNECIFFVNPSEIRRIEALSEGAREYSIRFDIAMLRFLDADEIETGLLGPLQDRKLIFPRKIDISNLGNAAIMESLTRVLEHFCLLARRYPSILSSERLELRSVADQLLLKSELLQIIAQLDSYGLLTELRKRARHKQAELIREVIVYIREHYSEKIYVSDLANMCRLNEHYFIRFFKRVVGLSPLDYVNRYRITVARRELLESSDKIVTVALRCGFQSNGNFIRTFRNVTGMRPNEWRKRHREAEENDILLSSRH